MYDLPMDTTECVHEYNQFRKKLKRMGFIMIQFSIYVKVVLNEAGYKKMLRNIQENIPKHGDIRILKITEKQYETMLFLRGRRSLQEEMISDNEIIVFREQND